MNNLTKIKILRPANEVFEAFVDPSKIGSFWFSSSSERWEEGKTITLIYEEYGGVRGDIKIINIEENKKIVFQWDYIGEEHVVTITLKELDNASTIVEVNEEGFNENNNQLISSLISNKQGWVYALTCLKGYLEFGVNKLRAASL